MTKQHILLVALLWVTLLPLHAQNPFLPLWEHVPDAEPYVFEDPDNAGHMRVYIYGSHDVLGNAYCGRDQVVWSAPVEDLTNWRCEGISFTSIYDRDGNLLNADGLGDILFAPDVTMRIEDGHPVYYLYPNTQAEGRYNMVARSNRPAGPFTVCNWSSDDPKRVEGILGFDPAVFVDDDGRVYGYWGFDEAYCAELDPATMCTLKRGTTIHKGHISSRHEPGPFRFYEASSMRKIEDKYVFIYSRWTAPGEFGLEDNNYTLAYAYGDSPLGPFTYGGTLIDGRAPEHLSSALDNLSTSPWGGVGVRCTAHPRGNTHGSIFCSNGQYWLIYHRQTGYDEYHRQTMAAPLDVHVEHGKGGKVTILQAEYTSEGFRTQGLDPGQTVPAGLACYYTGGAMVMDSIVTNVKGGAVVGFKYLNFDRCADCRLLDLTLIPRGVTATVEVWLDNPFSGKRIGRYRLRAKGAQGATTLSIPVKLYKLSGKHALFFVFHSSDSDTSICDLNSFRFTCP